MNQYYQDPNSTKSSPVEIVVVIDRSGSMASIRDDAIGGFNTFLKEQQALPGEALLTLVLFDDKYEVPVEAKPISWVKPLTRETFVPRGWTALNDAIGRAMAGLEARKPDKAVIVILTDGGENASKEYSAEQIRTKITTAQDRGWRVQYLAANQDAFQVGRTLGVNPVFTSNWTANAAGTSKSYMQASIGTTSYRADVKPEEQFFDELAKKTSNTINK